MRQVGRDRSFPALDDERLRLALERYGAGLDTVLPADERMPVMDAANVCGSIAEITDQLHPSVVQLARDVARAMDLRFCGVDVVMADATAPLDSYTILETNSAPGLAAHIPAGPDRRRRIDDLYVRLLGAAGSMSTKDV